MSKFNLHHLKKRVTGSLQKSVFRSVFSSKFSIQHPALLWPHPKSCLHHIPLPSG